ncbi:MAG: hypothetical protein KDD99_25050, partial [Bacteroidetes bacterium]|nr:hypothetical protein [Bacteroidota bacterium]
MGKWLLWWGKKLHAEIGEYAEKRLDTSALSAYSAREKEKASRRDWRVRREEIGYLCDLCALCVRKRK